MIHILKITTSLALSAGLMITSTQVPYNQVNRVQVDVNGTSRTYFTSKDRVGELLEEIGVKVGPQDELNVALTDQLHQTDHIMIEKARKVSVMADGLLYERVTQADNVAALLKEMNLSLGEHDRLSSELTAPVTEGMKLILSRVRIMEQTKVIPVAYGQTRVQTADLPKGEEKVERSGQMGQRISTRRMVYVDGQLTGEEILSDYVESLPVAETILVGTKEPVVVKKTVAVEKKPVVKVRKAPEVKKPGAKKVSTTDTDTDSDSDKNWKTFTLSFYTNLPSENGGYTITATGESLRYGMVASNYYSLGKKIYLSGWGTFTVKDRGGSNFYSSTRLDVFIPRRSGESNSTYLARVNNMGLKKVKGYVK